MIAERESAALAEELISQTCARQVIQREQLTIHADRGSAMTSKPVAFLLAELGVTKPHSHSHVSNDNPYSEAQFKTMKYRPDYPTRFGCLQDARAWAAEFFQWYNREHHPTRNKNENSHCKSAVPVLFVAMTTVHEFCLEKSLPLSSG